LGPAQPAEILQDFVRDYGERAFQCAYRLTGNMEEAKDLVQEAFYRVLRNWKRYDPSQALESWFFIILRHLFLDARKGYERRYVISMDGFPESGEENLSLSDLLPEQDEAILEKLGREESAREVHRALESLSYEHRAVLTLCDMQRLSYEEIAQVLQVPIGTVRSRVSRARQALRHLMLQKSQVV
jgi:RNA polymerase sigma-70 factor (ECF subfamily)